MTLTADDYPDETVAEYGYGYTTLKRLQESIESYFTQAGVSLPERRFVAMGDVASQSWDSCEQLTINLTRIYLGTPGEGEATPQASNCELALAGNFVVQLVRCVPTAKVIGRTGKHLGNVEVEDIEASALVQAIDAQLLLEAVRATPSVQRVRATVSPSGVQSNMQAVVAEVSISLAP